MKYGLLDGVLAVLCEQVSVLCLIRWAVSALVRVSSILYRLRLVGRRTLESHGVRSQLSKRERRHHAIFWYSTTKEKSRYMYIVVRHFCIHLFIS
jgi:hypothetical protein